MTLTRSLSSGPALNRNESPLSRLAAADPDFLDAHHVAAGERVRRLVERALLRQSVTMSYSGVVAGGHSHSGAGDIPDLAIDARRKINEIYEVLPRECAGAVIDICGFLKGLHQVESERGWPRRSAKLLLRVGLEQLARHFGMSSCAVGQPTTRDRAWLDEGARPSMY